MAQLREPIGESAYNIFELDITEGSSATFLYVLDNGDSQLEVRHKDTLAVIAKVGANGSGDAQYDNPQRVAVDLSRVYVTDTDNNRVKKVHWGSLAFDDEITNSDMGVAHSFFALAVDRARVLVGREDTELELFDRLLSQPYTEAESVCDSGTGDIVGLAMIQDYVFHAHVTAAKPRGVVVKKEYGCTQIASWDVPASVSIVKDICTDGTWVYVLCDDGANPGVVFILDAVDLLEQGEYALPAGKTSPVACCVDDDYFFWTDDGDHSINRVDKADGANDLAATDLTTPTGCGCLPPHYASLRLEGAVLSLSHGAAFGHSVTLGASREAVVSAAHGIALGHALADEVVVERMAHGAALGHSLRIPADGLLELSHGAALGHALGAEAAIVRLAHGAALGHALTFPTSAWVTRKTLAHDTTFVGTTTLSRESVLT